MTGPKPELIELTPTQETILERLVQRGVSAVRVKGAVAVGAISQSHRQRIYSLNRRAKGSAQPFNSSNYFRQRVLA